MKVEKNVYSNKLGVDLMIYISEEDNVIGTNPCAPNTRIKTFVVTQEVDNSEKRLYENEYWIPNDANKFVNAFKRAFRDGESKFLLDKEAKKEFESLFSTQINVSAEALVNKKFMSKELLEALAEGHTLGILTNGLVHVER